MSLTLYYDLLSQPSRALYIFLKVCNISFTKKLVNLGKLEQLTPEFKKINQFQKVPVIDHNGFKLTESVAIARYVTREFNVPDHWYPKDSKHQAKVDEYLEWQHLNTRIFCALYFQEKFLKPLRTGVQPKPEKIKKYESSMKACLDLLENTWFKDTPFVIDSDITFADLLCACEVEQVRIAGYNPCDGRPRLSAWLKRIAEKTNPYYEEAHVPLQKVMQRVQEHELQSKI